MNFVNSSLNRRRSKLCKCCIIILECMRFQGCSGYCERADLLVIADVVHGSGFTIEMCIAVVARLFRLAPSVIPLVCAATFAYNVTARSTVRSVNNFEMRQTKRRKRTNGRCITFAGST